MQPYGDDDLHLVVEYLPNGDARIAPRSEMEDEYIEEEDVSDDDEDDEMVELEEEDSPEAASVHPPLVMTVEQPPPPFVPVGAPVQVASPQAIQSIFDDDDEEEEDEQEIILPSQRRQQKDNAQVLALKKELASLQRKLEEEKRIKKPQGKMQQQLAAAAPKTSDRPGLIPPRDMSKSKRFKPAAASSSEPVKIGVDLHASLGEASASSGSSGSSRDEASAALDRLPEEYKRQASKQLLPKITGLKLRNVVSDFLDRYKRYLQMLNQPFVRFAHRVAGHLNCNVHDLLQNPQMDDDIIQARLDRINLQNARAHADVLRIIQEMTTQKLQSEMSSRSSALQSSSQAAAAVLVQGRVSQYGSDDEEKDDDEEDGGLEDVSRFMQRLSSGLKTSGQAPSMAVGFSLEKNLARMVTQNHHSRSSESSVLIGVNMSNLDELDESDMMQRINDATRELQEAVDALQRYATSTEVVGSQQQQKQQQQEAMPAALQSGQSSTGSMSIVPLFEEQQQSQQPKNDIIVEMTRLTLTINQAREDLNTLIKAFNKRFNKKQDGAATAAVLRDEVKKQARSMRKRLDRLNEEHGNALQQYINGVVESGLKTIKKNTLERELAKPEYLGHVLYKAKLSTAVETCFADISYQADNYRFKLQDLMFDDSYLVATRFAKMVGCYIALIELRDNVRNKTGRYYAAKSVDQLQEELEMHKLFFMQVDYVGSRLAPRDANLNGGGKGFGSSGGSGGSGSALGTMSALTGRLGIGTSIHQGFSSSSSSSSSSSRGGLDVTNLIDGMRGQGAFTFM